MRPGRALPFALAAAACAAQAPLTLSMALHQAGTGSAQADLAGYARRSAESESQEVRSTYLPEFRFQGGHLSLDRDQALKTAPVSLGPLPLLGTLTVPSMAEPVAQNASWRYQVTASYLLFDFGKRSSALEASLGKEAAVDLRGREEVRRAQAQAAGRYLALFDLKARRAVVAQRLQALGDHLKDAEALFDQGVVARNDVLRTQVALREVQDAGRALDTAMASAWDALDVAMGLPPGTPGALPESLPDPRPLPWDEARIRARAAEGNQGVKALDAKARAASSEVAYRKRDFAPDVVAQLGHAYEENTFLVHQQQTSFYLGLSWKVFDGGARSARVSKARAQEDTARRELLEARRGAESAAVAAYRDYKDALAEMATAKANVEAAQENLRIVSEQYQQAYAKSADVLDAEAVLAESRFSLSDRLCRAYAAQAGLLAVLGEDMEAFFAPKPTEP